MINQKLFEVFGEWYGYVCGFDAARDTHENMTKYERMDVALRLMEMDAALPVTENLIDEEKFVVRVPFSLPPIRSIEILFEGGQKSIVFKRPGDDNIDLLRRIF